MIHKSYTYISPFHVHVTLCLQAKRTPGISEDIVAEFEKARHAMAARNVEDVLRSALQAARGQWSRDPQSGAPDPRTATATGLRAALEFADANGL